MKDPYSILGVSPNASPDEVKKAYRELARKYHPDNYQNNPLADLAEEKMKEINEAYDAITKGRSAPSSPGPGPSQGYQHSGYGYQQQYSSSVNPTYQQVRNLINMGDIATAERLLQEVPQRDAEWYFLTGGVALKRNWLDEAMQNFSIACRMDPGNLEYRQALAMTQQSGPAYLYAGGGMDTCECCTTLVCLNCLCGGGRC